MGEERPATYSRNVFIPLTNACRNRCGYCGFRSRQPTLMSRTRVRAIMEEGARHGCKEALFTLGERPEVHPAIRAELRSMGYATVIEYLYDLCLEAKELKLLPHTNAGVIGGEELRALGEVNASLGLMLESVSERLCEPGMPHEGCPGKWPPARLEVLEEAGRLRIPFTTGILVGIGESYDEVIASLEAIKELHNRHGHIQEVIIQNFKPKRGTPMASHPEPSPLLLLKVIATAREMLPGIGIQTPPNLNSHWNLTLLYGANDLGGISPVTVDHINPEAPWPGLEGMRQRAADVGFRLRERLPIYPGFVLRGWYPAALGDLVADATDGSGLVREG